MSLQQFKLAYFTVEDRSVAVIATVTQSRLSEEDNLEQFAVELNQIIESSGHYWLVLDLQSVNLITSSAVGKLIALHRNLRRHDGRLAMCGVTGNLRNVFQTAKLIDYFHVATSVDDAVDLLTREKTSQEMATIGKPR